MKIHAYLKLAKVIVLGVLLTSSLTALAQSSITRSSSFEYNAQGLLVKEVIEPDNTASGNCHVTEHAYDGFGNKAQVTSRACGNATGTATWSANQPRIASSVYSADGRFPQTTTNALGHSESKTYDARFGLPKTLIGPNGLQTSWDYDGFGRKTRETRADGTYSTWVYQYCSEAPGCPANFTASSASAAGVGGAILPQVPVWYVVERSYGSNNLEISASKLQYHDALGRTIRVETKGFDGGASPAIVQVQDTAYNHLGQIARKSNTHDYTQPATAAWINYQYDQLGRLIQEEAPDTAASSAGGIARTTIAYSGLSSTITNSKQQTKTTLKDALGRTQQVTDHLGGKVQYAYDALGQLTQTNAEGNITTIAYNIRGQKIRMDDPAMGVWEYAYNAFGELVWQSDSLGKASTIAYDRLGRMIKRSEPDLVSDWIYDTCAKGIGKLCQAKSDNGYNRVHSYDSLGRPSATSTKLDTTVTTSVSYEVGTGRVLSKTYPTGYVASYQYTQLGYVKTVTGQGAGATKVARYDVLAINAQGQITSYKYGNQVITNKTYDAQTGRLQTITATKEGLATGGIQQTSYQYDSLSNLTARGDVNTGVQETFGYDSLNRLINYTAQGGSVTSQDASSHVDVRYDARGNITYKSDVGQYFYDPARPNRITSIIPEALAGASAPFTGKRRLVYAFDDYAPGARAMGNGLIMGNGNLIYTVSQDLQNNRHTVRWEKYTSFNMPQELLFGALVNSQNPTNTVASRTLTFVYGPEHQRIMQRTQVDGSAPSSMRSGRVYYLNGANNDLGYEKEVTDAGMTEHKHYLSAGGMVFAMQITRSGNLAQGGSTKPVENLQYLHTDHLGSVAVVTDHEGSVTERLAYDPWGKRRFPNGTADTNDSIIGLTLDRGFTMHEHLDEMGLIHMNGRIFDPLIGRFMSADPFIQAPENLQSHNRFAYVMNNPLNHTDPSGYFSLKKFFKTIIKEVVVRVVLAVADTYCGGCASLIYNAYQGYKSGGVVGLVASFVPGLNESPLGRAAVGCASAASMGGNCGRGALAAGARGLGGDTLPGQLLAGCVSARINGGSCGDGAADAAIPYTLKAASSFYEENVGFRANPLPGENRESDNKYTPNDITGRQEPADRTLNVIGLNDDTGFARQGGPLSRTLNRVFGLNSTAAYHDYLFNKPGGLEFNLASNVLTMAPAALLSYTAIAGNTLRNSNLISVDYLQGFKTAKRKR